MMATRRVKPPVEAQLGSLDFTDIITEDEGAPGHGALRRIFDVTGDSSAPSAGGGGGIASARITASRAQRARTTQSSNDRDSGKSASSICCHVFKYELADDNLRILDSPFVRAAIAELQLPWDFTGGSTLALHATPTGTSEGRGDTASSDDEPCPLPSPWCSGLQS